VESLAELKKVSCGGEVLVMDKLREDFPSKFNESGAMDYKWFESEVRPKFKVYIRNDVGSIAFTMMTKPASEGGKGCQFTDLIEVALHQLKYFNGVFPCRENSITITKLEEALMWQKARTENRVAREVEGQHKA
jgi:hypothetical protein